MRQQRARRYIRAEGIVITYDEQLEAFKRALATAMELTNGLSPKRTGEAFVEVLGRQHRTIQQVFMGAVKLGIHEYAQTKHYDQRNQASVEWAKLVDELPNSDLKFPCI